MNLLTKIKENFGWIFLWTLVLLMAFSGVYEFVEGQGWNERWECTQFNYLTEQDNRSAESCLIVGCVEKDLRKNSPTWECGCEKEGNLTDYKVNTICVSQIKMRDYKGWWNE
jgi:hypothetical protein